jgi:hypothetical protein
MDFSKVGWADDSFTDVRGRQRPVSTYVMVLWVLQNVARCPRPTCGRGCDGPMFRCRRAGSRRFRSQQSRHARDPSPLLPLSSLMHMLNRW